MDVTLITDQSTRALQHVLKQYFGYESFRPLQLEAMSLVLQRRDSVVILPTGGGKSLCYQVPSLCRAGLALVVSPLISLMKDQVDALRSAGIAAAYTNSSLTLSQRRDVEDQVLSGRLKLLYVAPERLLTPRTIELLQQVELALIAVDEAHCVSMWGHDFRPEYRELRQLREHFPQVSMHAYTATASEQVRQDIGQQLGLREPELLVGSFDRPNLYFRVKRRQGLLSQVTEILERHPGESGIIYCITKREVDQLCEQLVARGVRARTYHADLSDQDRKRNQEAFVNDQVDVIVATIAFGMGIDKPDVRFVIHAGMPKSIENYQQESGRAGRDGLEAECWLLYSGQDFRLWKQIIEGSERAALETSMRSLTRMADFCHSVVCRHQTLAAHFGEQLPGSCGACDVCLEELDQVAEPLVIGQMILSCVARLRQRYGGDYTAKVLVGAREQRIMQSGHHELSTYGLLSEYDRMHVRDWIEQLVEQQFLEKEGEYRVLSITSTGRELLRGEVMPRLLRPKQRASGRRSSQRSTKTSADSWDGVDRGLYQALRQLRTDEAETRQLPAYMVFGDASLRDMARRQPISLQAFLQCHGVGDKKLSDYGEQFVELIKQHLGQREQGPTSSEGHGEE